ncbi:unnamed protein product [Musa hybrid cultivar]
MIRFRVQGPPILLLIFMAICCAKGNHVISPNTAFRFIPPDMSSRHVHHGILQLADSFDGPTASHSHHFLWLYLSEFGTCIIPSQRPTSFPAQSIQNLLNEKKTTKTMFQWLGEPS